ncbi:MAG: DUF1292 domain-containing protein [Defluviitaleaceae bacterium]|nr:DUF1292 domain-containing protein [Defluviitaleaceae bacterium]
MLEDGQEMNMLTVIDEEGQEIECEILFTFDSPEYKKNYVVYTPIGDEYVDEEGYPELHVSAYTTDEDGEGGGLEPIEDEAEWEMIEEVVAAFIEEQESDDEPVS